MSWTGKYIPLPLHCVIYDVGKLCNNRLVTGINVRQGQWELHSYPTYRQMCVLFYSRIKSTKSLSCPVPVFSASLTNRTILLPQSRDYSCYVSRPILAPPPLWLQKHTDLSAHDFVYTCGISLGSPTIPAPEAGDFVRLTLLYIVVPLILLQSSSSSSSSSSDGACSPVAGYGLLIHEVSRSHTTAHRSRYDSSGRVISPSQRPLPDNTQVTTDRRPCPRWESNPQSQQASGRKPTP